MVRIKDVAERAGVSTATVSRVINGKSVKPHYRVAVERAVEELDYQPDRQARLLRLQRSDTIALVLPDIENPFYTTLARGVIDETRAAGFSAVLWNSDDLVDKENSFLDTVRSDKVAGVVIAASTPDPNIDGLLAEGRPVVAVDRPISRAVDSVILDHQALGRRGTADLVARGYQRIACIAGPSAARTAVDRADGWRKEMRRHNLRIGGLLQRTNAHVDGAKVAVEALLALDDPPDAIFAANNLIGIGVLQVLDQLDNHTMGMCVIGELPFATSHSPNTTVIPLYPRVLGETAAQMLVERINGLGKRPRRVVQPVPEPQPLIWR